MEMTLLVGKAPIVAAIADISLTGKKLDGMIQNAACSIINHVELHGDVTLSNSLIAAMPKGSRVNALLAFLEAFGKVRWDAATKTMVFDKEGTTDLEGALVAHWTEFKPEPPYAALILSNELEKLLTRADKQRLDNDDRNDIHETDMAAIRELSATLAANKEARLADTTEVEETSDMPEAIDA